MYGVEVHYMPRKYISKKLLLEKLFVQNLMMHIQQKHMLTLMMDMGKAVMLSSLVFDN